MFISQGYLQHERKLYIVTHWESGLRKEVSFTKGDTLRRFLISVGIGFNVGHISRLYALYPESTHEQRLKIDSDDKLHEVFNHIDSDCKNLEILYLYPEDKSPISSPSTGVSPSPCEVAHKSETSSSKSDRSSYQKRFKKELMNRDNSKCLLCSCMDALHASHIVDADDAKLSSDEKRTLGMANASDRYAVYNGLLLCANCHSKYDNWELGVDDDGYLITRSVSGTVKGWIRNENVNVYTDPSDKKSSPKNPLSVLLKWKYDRFLLKRDRVSTVMFNLARGLLSPTKPTRK